MADINARDVLPNPMARWNGKDPVEVVGILETRLAEARQENQELKGHPGTSTRPKRQRRSDRRQTERFLISLRDYLLFEDLDEIDPVDLEAEMEEHGETLREAALAEQIGKAWKMIVEFLASEEEG